MPLCPKCLKSFRSATDLQRHLDRKFPCDAGEVTCSGCAQTFTNKQTLKVHHETGACKGKPRALVTQELAQENAALRERLDQQNNLLQMTNRVTAAAATNIVIDNTGINTGTQNIIGSQTVNIENLHVSCGIGLENLSHLSKLTSQEFRGKLSLVHGPQSMADWCALLRADEEHPENHNA